MNNARILCDVIAYEMTKDNGNEVIKVHFRGGRNVSRIARKLVHMTAIAEMGWPS